MTLHELVEETVQAIRENLEADGTPRRIPIQSREAARLVLDKYQEELGTRLDHSSLTDQMSWMQQALKVVPSWRVFEDTSLTRFIGLAAEKKMGKEYPELLSQRYNQSTRVPVTAGD